ncbi:MAG: FecR domain-containing protein [Deltaproteobacteria bacterium]|nr:FecR domain-containing protein [Deltaproteobacteria bacterium]
MIYGKITDERLEELLVNLRPDYPDEPLHFRVDDFKRHRIVNAVLSEWEDTSQTLIRPKSSARSFRIAAVAALTIGTLLIGAYLAISGPSVNSSANSNGSAQLLAPNTGMEPQLVPQSRFSLLQGDVNCGNTSVKLGASVPMEQWIETRNGQSAFSLPTGIAVGLADNSAARVFWNGKRKYEVEINQGKALFSVDPQKSREGFFVRTPNGRIKVTGTLFTVEVGDRGEVDVRLHRGKVEIQSGKGGVHYVEAGQTATLRDHSVGVRASNDNNQGTSQLYKLGCFDSGQTFSELTRQDCDSQRVLSEDARAMRGSRQPANRTKVSSLSELLHAARVARRDGDWETAASMYRQLIRDFPGTANSRTALVTLAEIELKQLNAPKAALKHFNAYLKSPGALEREALYGKAKAYRAMNNGKLEQKTLKQLVASFPSGPISQAADKRLQELADLD